MQEESGVVSFKGEVIKVIGVGGGGCNAIYNMLDSKLDVKFICANTDAKSLLKNEMITTLQLGKELTRGLGAGSDPEIGAKATEEDQDEISALLKDTDMLFIAAGMGGGTGTGASPVVASIARELGILTVGVVTRPFAYEGAKRTQVADEGIIKLREVVDSLIVLPNENLIDVLGEGISMREAFKAADNVLRNAVLGITEVIKTPGVVSLDFADVKTVMSRKGLAMMGSAIASGDDRAHQAATNAISSPLLQNIVLTGAKGVLLNVTSHTGDIKLGEFNEISRIIQSDISADADFKTGMAEVCDDSDLKENEIRVTVIATGLSEVVLNKKKVEISLSNKDDNIFAAPAYLRDIKQITH